MKRKRDKKNEHLTSMIDFDVHKNLIILNLSEKRVSPKHNRHPMINDNDNVPTTYYTHTYGGEKEESQQSRARNAPKKIIL